MGLTIIKSGEDLVVESRDVAKMVGKEHYNLLRDIRNYVEILDSSKLKSRNFFIESSYLNEQNKEQPCYMLTRKGCDMVANKMTGEKGVLFTAAYVTKFEEMEKQIKSQLTPIDLIIQSAQQLKLIEEKQKEQELRLETFEQEQRVLKGKVDIINDKEYTIMGYANLHNIQLNNKLANNLGRKASKISRAKDYLIGSATHPVFGRVNTYHVDILDIVFDEF